ncbi:MAG: TonB family protein [Pseudomonadota bacterium]
MSAHTLQQQAGMLHGRQMVLLVTIGLHALVIAVLMTMQVMPEKLFDRPLLPVDEFVQMKTVDPPPHSLKPDIARPMPTAPLPIPTPEFQDERISLPTAISIDSTPIATAPPEPVGTGAVAQVPAPTPLQFRAVRPADAYYPSQSLNLQEEGTAIVRVCVSPAGKVDGKPVIETTSGSPRLDAAAITWAREALRFTPATQGGIAIAACKGFRVVFNLH